MNEPTKGEPSLGSLLGSLASDTGTLVRQEIHLASTEMTQKMRSATREIGMIALGGALAHAGFIAVMAAIILALGSFLPMWAVALGLGLVTFAAGWAVLNGAIRALRTLDPVPQRTLETLQQDKAWAKEQIR